MRNKEQQAAQMRYEWRKSCETSYDRQMEENKKKAAKDAKEVLTGPTTIAEVGTNYEKQLKKLKFAENRMDNRCNRVADVIKAPPRKHVAAESRNHEDHGLIADKRHEEYDRQKATLSKLSSQENYARGIDLKPSLNRIKHEFTLPDSPSKRPPTPEVDKATNE